MRSLIGLLWALGGGVAGLIIGIIGANVFASATDMSTREGARGYFVIAIGLVCAVIGLIVGLVLYGRSAPAGQAAENVGSGALAFVALIAAIALGLWAFMQLREKPLEYNGTQATLEMEFRLKTADIPANAPERWLSVEVQTAKTRPEGTPYWSSKRVEGEYTIVPVTQGPLYRSGSRMIVVRVGEQQIEVFSPPMKRTPDPKADWSEWYRPRVVDPPYGVTPSAPLKSILELRYKLRLYGD
jgi:hypothetical protein